MVRIPDSSGALRDFREWDGPAVLPPRTATQSPKPCSVPRHAADRLDRVGTRSQLPSARRAKSSIRSACSDPPRGYPRLIPASSDAASFKGRIQKRKTSVSRSPNPACNARPVHTKCQQRKWDVSLNHFVSTSPQRWWHRTTESVWPSDAQLCCQFQDTINAGAF